jgi:hypothetical protein
VSPDQTRLFVYFVKPLPSPPGLAQDNFRIEGGERIRDIRVAAEPHLLGLNCLRLRLNGFGDFSGYLLRLVAGTDDASAPPGFDPELCSVEFSFKVSCPSEFDCRTQAVCSGPLPLSPDINYLARDYASLRQVLLDRLGLLAPDWRERSPADLQVTLVELLAFVGDRLSYQQDAVGSEAYLGTARRRVSGRRHARLVDYEMGDGCNARVWVAVCAREGVRGEWLAGPGKGRAGTLLLGGAADRGVIVPPEEVERELAAGAIPFECMHGLGLYEEHNRLEFYTWGDLRCCLPAGSTKATLRGHRPYLKAGDVLVLEEVLGPLTGECEDADPTHRHAVRLSHVVSTTGATPLTDPVTGQEITEVQWAEADALPFSLCISSVRESEAGGREAVMNVSVALGNVVLADHGLSVLSEPLGLVPGPVPGLFWSVPTFGPCEPIRPEPVLPRFQPRLAKGPVTQAVQFPSEQLFELNWPEPPAATVIVEAFAASGIALRGEALSIQGGHGEWSVSDGVQAFRLRAFSGRLRVERPGGPAQSVMRWSADRAVPCVRLSEHGTGEEWLPRRDLLSSNGQDRHFVVEVEADGGSTLRFGDDRCGKRPDAGTVFEATYRVGNGSAGNVGQESVRRVVGELFLGGLVAGLSNPLPAQGGMEPESIEDVRKNAPEAFRIQERAVTPDDYAAMAERHPEVQKAAGTLRWTGSWYTVFVTIDRKGGLDVDAGFEADVRRHLEKYRMAGHDLVVDGPRYVSLEVELAVCVRPDYFRSDVKAALLELFSNRQLAAGRCGLFHPDNFTFGQPVFLSPLYAAAQAVPGVAWVKVTKFQRQGMPSVAALESGRLVLDRLEIARLDNDPNFPERGVLRLCLEGGK